MDYIVLSNLHKAEIFLNTKLHFLVILNLQNSQKFKTFKKYKIYNLLIFNVQCKVKIQT